MSQIKYRGNTSAKIFPFISKFFGQSVIVQGQDQNFSRQLTASEDLDKDRGIPQMYYCQNVMPSAQGLQSVGYTNPVAGFTNEVNFTPPVILRDSTEKEVYFDSTIEGRNFVLPFGNPSWQQINSIVGTAGKMLTTAYVNGQSYLYFANIGCFKFDTVTNMLVPVTLSGLDVTKVLGITAAAGYMLAWTKSTIAWSSTLDPTDFVPSLITGAGGGGIEQARGPITLCVTHQLGFIVYTTENSVAALYSGNARYPFNYKELVASGGLAGQDLISYDGNTGNHYAYTTSGLQLISMTGTKTVFPEITDFVSGKLFEDYDSVSKSLVQTKVPTGTTMKKYLQVVSDRYLVISYGINSLTHALVYDIVQNRFGKLKLDHVACFEWKLLTPEVTETPRESLGFLQKDGGIKVVDFSYDSATSDGVVFLGKFQYVRTRKLQLQQMVFESIPNEADFTVTHKVANDGIPDLNYTTYLASNVDNQRIFNSTRVGTNHTLILEGSFYLDSFVLAFNVHGRR